MIKNINQHIYNSIVFSVKSITVPKRINSDWPPYKWREYIDEESEPGPKVTKRDAEKVIKNLLREQVFEFTQALF